MYQDLADRNIYENARINFVFDFFSPYQRKHLAHVASKALLRKVTYSNKFSLFTKAMESSTKMYPNYLGGERMHTLESGFVPYNEAVNMLMRASSFIQANGFTTDKCRMKLFINLDHRQLNIRESQMLNKIKFGLRINEGKYFDVWYDDVFERPRRNFVSYVYPKGIFTKNLDENSIIDVPINEFNYPDSQYFGIDFNYLRNGYVGLSYPGGKNYHLRKDEILELLDNGVKIYHNVLNENSVYTEDDIIKFRGVFNEQRKLVDSIKTYDSFKIRHKNIKLFYDLDENEEKIKFKYNEFRDVLFELLAYGDVVRGEINYDSDRGAMQVRNTVVRNGVGIRGIEFYESKLTGDFYDCAFSDCKIYRSRAFNGLFTNETLITNSILRNADFRDNTTEMHNTYIDNDDKFVIDGKLTNCVVRNGVVQYNASVDKGTVIIKTND